MCPPEHPVIELSTLQPVSADPQCEEASLGSLDSLITPVERFYVRNHFSKIPELSRSTWRLSIDGEVRKPLNLSLADLEALPSQEQVATFECAGNSRSYLTPPAEGLAFRHGAVSTARWRGVPLALVLAEAGLKDTAHEVVFEGADYGREEEDGVAFDLKYTRSLPVSKALHPDTLLTYQMNGEALSPVHGYPLRLVTPGWYAMASVKWLMHIRVSERPFEGFFQSRRYVIIQEGVENKIEREPVTLLRVKSLITSPRHGEVIQPGTFTIQGVAWSGTGSVEKVAVSTDGGRHWREARLTGENHPNAWRRWELVWRPAEPGHFIIMARATDSAGNTQPKAMPWNFRGYANNSSHAIAVEVPASRPIPTR
ncbi:MAG TPA: sulfite oxidase [Dehalococcoidia bacterium]|nr:sulfite oxidase [Dehalococcoidia bacterium]